MSAPTITGADIAFAQEIGLAYVAYRKAAKEEGRALVMFGHHSQFYLNACLDAETAEAEWRRLVVIVECDA